MLALLIAASLARQDIVEIRHDRWPNHTEVLGWTADDEIVVWHTECGAHDGSGFPFCEVTLTVAGAAKTSTQTLLSIENPDSDVDAQLEVPYEVARDFIHAEERALEALGELAAGSAQERPYDYRAKAYHTSSWSRCIGVYRGKHRVRRVSCVDSDSDVSVKKLTIQAVDVSSTGRVAIVIDVGLFELDTDWDEQRVVVLDPP